LQTRSAAPVWLAFTPGLFVFLWATGFIGARLSADNAEPFSFLFVRCIIVARSSPWRPLPSGRRGQAGVRPSTPWWWARSSTEAISARLLVHQPWPARRRFGAHRGLQPLLTALVAAPVLGERITARHWLGLAVGILGIALVVWPKLTFGDHGITPLTVGASMFATLSIAIGSVYQKRHITGLDLRSGNVLQFLGAAAAVGLIALLSENLRSPGPARSSLPWSGWCWCCRSAPRPCSI
jgi:drug/metabolite transporter (DMT)-like permease